MPVRIRQEVQALPRQAGLNPEALLLHRDDAVLVLDKPHGLPVQGGPGIRLSVDAMMDALRFGAPERPRLVHRLDRDTSGVLVLARGAAAAARWLAGMPHAHKMCVRPSCFVRVLTRCLVQCYRGEPRSAVP